MRALLLSLGLFASPLFAQEAPPGSTSDTLAPSPIEAPALPEVPEAPEAPEDAPPEPTDETTGAEDAPRGEPPVAEEPAPSPDGEPQEVVAPAEPITEDTAAEELAVPDAHAGGGHGDEPYAGGEGPPEHVPHSPAQGAQAGAVEQAPETQAPHPAPAQSPTPSPSITPFLWPLPAPAPDVPRVDVHAAPSPWAAYLLPLPERGAWTALRFLFWLLLMLVADIQLDRARGRLLPEGILPTALALLSQALRLVALFAALLVIAALLPPSLLPILPIAVLGGALALGVSIWTVLPDVWSGVLLTVEQRLQPGQWIRVGELAGEIERVGLRATCIRDRHGRHVYLPNRLLAAEAIAADEVRWPEVDIAVPVPPELSAEQVRALLDEAITLSPFLAPNCDAALMQLEFSPPVWRVRTRIVESHWADEFEGALRERVRELLENR